MATNTTNYQLIKPAGSEKYNISIFNDNWDIIDGKIKLNADNILKKQNTITGAATTVVSSNLTANRVIISNASGKFAVSAVTATELGYLSGAKSKIQTQIDNEVTARTSAVTTLQTNVDKKVSKAGDTMTGDLSLTGTASRWIRIKRTDLDRSVEQTFPTSGTTYIGGFGLFDKTDNAMMSVNRSVNSTGVVTTFQNSQFVNGAQRNSNINLIISSTGETYTTTNTVTNPASNNTCIATTAWVNTASSVVHTSGNEIIAGTKKFTGGVLLQSTSYVNNDYSQGWHILQHLRFDDKDGFEMGHVRRFASTGTQAMAMTARAQIGENIVSTSLEVHITPDGSRYAIAPATRTSGYGTTDIVTTGWADAKYVDVAGDTMKGKLIVNNESYIKLELKNPSADLTTGEQAYNNSIIFIDKNNKQMGQLKNDATVTNSVPQSTMSMSAKSLDSDNNVIWSTITCVAMTNGTVYAIAPNPSSKSDNSARIATTQWVNSASTVVHTSGNETVAGTKTFTGIPVIKGNDYRRIQIHNTGITPGDGKVTDYGGIELLDSTGTRRGMFRGAKDSDDMNSVRIVAYNTKNDAEVSGAVTVYITTDGTTYATAPATRSTGYGSTDIVTAGWADEKFVKRAGDSMNGILTMNNDIIRVHSSPEDTLPSTYENRGSIYFRDLMGVNRGVIRCDADTTYTRTYFTAERTVNGERVVNRMDLRILEDGTSIMLGVTPSNASENSTQIATTAWVNKASTVVHSTGNETISGGKTFTANLNITASGEKGTIITRTDKALGDGWSRYRWDRAYDKNGVLMGDTLLVGDAGSVTHYLEAFNRKSDGTTVSASLAIRATKDGAVIATAPATRASGYSSTDIATAGWVDTKLAALETKINETRNYIISDTEPTSEDGEDGDIWFVYE